MNDAADIVRDYLLTQSAITDLTGEGAGARIWAELTYPPSGTGGYKPSDGAAIVFKSTPGSFDAANALLRNRWQFKIYGPTIYAIRNLYLATMDVMHDTQGRGHILSSQPVGPGTMLSDPGSGWSFMLVFIETMVYSGLPLNSPT